MSSHIHKTRHQSFAQLDKAYTFERLKSNAGNNTNIMKHENNCWVVYWSPGFLSYEGDDIRGVVVPLKIPPNNLIAHAA